MTAPKNLNLRCPYPDCADEYEYRMSGSCANCRTKVTGTFTFGHQVQQSGGICPKWKDRRYDAWPPDSRGLAGPEPKIPRPVCPGCGCQRIGWDKLA